MWWERLSDRYDRRFAPVLGGAWSMAWGLWRIPESKLRLLGPVRDRDVLELGCGGARWSAALAGRGARAVGIDLSPAQLGKARAVVRRRKRVGLVRGNAEVLPFANASFDLVLSDWGAMTFCDPHRTVPEVARVLRPGGSLVFVSSTPWRAVALDRVADRMGPVLKYDYFGLGRVDYPGEVNFVLGYSDWIDLFQNCELDVRALVEPRAPRVRSSRYLNAADERWARRWPIELIWKVTKRPLAGRRPARARARGVAGRRER